jgi:hypothetical protein
MDAVPAPAGLVAELQLTVPSELLRHLVHGFWGVRDHTNEPHRLTPAVFCNADGNGRLVDVHADE